MPLVRRLLGLVVLAAGLGLSPAAAQNVGIVQSDILVLDPERLFEETLFGQHMKEELQAERDEIIARNRKIEAELEAEEKLLTDLRAETSPEEFRQMADAFDAKVQEIRRDSERRVRDLERNRERAPLLFLRTVEPILVNVMRDAGGVVVLDARSVMLRSDVIDITGVAITRVDTELGDGSEASSATSEESDGATQDTTDN